MFGAAPKITNAWFLGQRMVLGVSPKSLVVS